MHSPARRQPIPRTAKRRHYQLPRPSGATWLFILACLILILIVIAGGNL